MKQAIYSNSNKYFLFCFLFSHHSGSLHLNDCPIERKIPIYLLVSGCFYILKTIVDLVVRFKRHREAEDTDENGNTKENSFSRLIGCFLFGFFIAGKVKGQGAPIRQGSLVFLDPLLIGFDLHYFCFLFTSKKV